MPIWSDSTPFTDFHALSILTIRLSPDGSLIAVSSGYSALGEAGPNTSTNIYTGATLTTAVFGAAIDWIDSNRLFVNRFRDGKFSPVYDHCEIVTAAGQVSACPALPYLRQIQPLTSNTIYSPQMNTVFDLTSGAALWTSASPTRGQGAAAANFVVFASGATVRIEPR